uniref:YHS domain-containing (seleno)protein n=1 Tax=Flavobacterium sp. TaxID=239 RepID=UPI0040497A55
MISNSIKKLTVVCFFTLFASLSFAQTNAERAQTFNLEKNLAIQGYDPVAYFSQNEAAKGKKSIATTFQGVIYYFSTEKNKQTFLKNPAQYEPQYGGWCAFALGSYGEKVEIDPETFKIIDGKLYLFYNAYFNNTLKTWNKDESNLKRKADLNWQKLTKTN